jgi:hypothetical protein
MQIGAGFLLQTVHTSDIKNIELFGGYMFYFVEKTAHLLGKHPLSLFVIFPVLWVATIVIMGFSKVIFK